MGTRAWAVAAALLGAAAVATAASSVAARSEAVGTNVFVSPGGPIEANLIDADNSPSVARDPVRPRTIVVTHRVDRPRFSAKLQRSTDGGRHFSETELPLPPGLDRPYAPSAAFGPDGTLYVLYANLTGAGNDPENLWLARSTDGGRTLAQPVRVAAGLSFQGRLAVGPGTLYVTWLQARAVGTLALTELAPVVLARSADGGLSWSEPVRVSDARRARVGAATPTIDGEGHLVVLYEDFKDDARDFQFLDGPAWDNPFALVVARSDDGGATFAEVEAEAEVVPARRFLVFLPEFPAVAAADSHLYIAWADARRGDLDVWLRRSDDGGRTWSEPRRVNDNPIGDGTDQYLPALAVAPDGRIDVAFYDRRRDPTNSRNDTELASSSDRGRSFTARRLSSTSFDAGIGARADARLPVDLGSRLGLASSVDGAFAAWTDTRFGTVDTGRQDIVGASVHRVMEPSVRLLLVAAGLVVLGALALARWAQGNRKRPVSAGVCPPTPARAPGADDGSPG